MMSGKAGEWAVAFHGVYTPGRFCDQNKTVIKSILEGLGKDNMLRAGTGQVYQKNACVNKPG